MIWWLLFGAMVLFWVVAVGANVLAWYIGKKRLDVLTFLYIPVWSLWLIIPLVLGLGISIFELALRPRPWRSTIGAHIALASLGAFTGTWIGSAMSGVVLRYFFKWADGPTVAPKVVLPGPPKPKP